MSAALKTLTLSILLLANFLTIPSIQAAGEPLSQDNYSAEIHSTYSLENMANGGLCLLAGMSPLGKCPGRTVEDGKLQVMLYDQVPGGGAFGGVTNMMVAMYTNPPTSTTQYLASLGEDFGFIQPAYAQVAGSGAGIVEPVRVLWQVMRNFAYLAFILIFMVVGLMIMFRQKMNPQTVITAQAALPGLVVGLILVTFSYFISALIIDLAFVGVQLVAQIFLQVKDANGAVMNHFNPASMAEESNILHLFASAGWRFDNFSEIRSGTIDTISSIFGGTTRGEMIGRTVPALIGGLIGFFTGFGPWGALVGSSAGLVTPEIIGVIIPFILIIILFIQLIRLFFGLLGSYIALLISTLTSPLIILISSIPGRGGALSGWWKTILGNALVFPAVFAAFLFAGMILATDLNSWKASPPLLGGFSTILLKLLIAYGIILGTPAIPDMVKKAIGVQDIQGIPQMALGVASTGFGITRGAAGKGWGKFIGPADNMRQARQKAQAEYDAGIAGAQSPGAVAAGARWIDRVRRRYVER